MEMMTKKIPMIIHEMRSQNRTPMMGTQTLNSPVVIKTVARD